MCTSAPFTTEVAECLQANCTVRESLALGRYQHSSCGAPIRSQTGLTRRVIWIMLTLTAISIIGRFIFRNPKVTGVGYGLDDWFILIAFAFLIALTNEFQSMSNEALGKDLWTLQPEQITATLYHFWIEAILYNFVMNFTKISIILLYLRVWTSANTWSGHFRLACFILIGLHVAYAIIIAFTVVFECNPISLAWTRWDNEHPGTCIDYLAQSYAVAAFNTILDFATFLLPLPKLVKLNVSNGKKIAVCGAFLIGFLATLFSIVRLAFLAEYGLSSNFTWYFAQIAIFTALECNLAVLCACLPSMAGPFLKACTGWKSKLGSRGSSKPRIIHLSTLDSWQTAREPSSNASTVRLQAMPDKHDERPIIPGKSDLDI